MSLVGCRSGVLGLGEADLLVGGVEHGVKALEESVAVDEVKTLSAVGAKVRDDKVDVTASATDLAVK